MVVEHLPSLSRRYAAQALGFEMTKVRGKHSQIWSTLFREKSKWTSFAINEHLNFYLLSDNFADAAYIAMVTRENEANAYLALSCLFHFLSAFNPCTRKRFKIFFKESNIILDITVLFSKPGLFPLKSLFECRDGLLCAKISSLEDMEGELA